MWSNPAFISLPWTVISWLSVSLVIYVRASAIYHTFSASRSLTGTVLGSGKVNFVSLVISGLARIPQFLSSWYTNEMPLIGRAVEVFSYPDQLYLSLWVELTVEAYLGTDASLNSDSWSATFSLTSDQSQQRPRYRRLRHCTPCCQFRRRCFCRHSQHRR